MDNQESFLIPTPGSTIDSDAPPPLPDWLTSPPPVLPPSPNRYLLAEVNHLIYEAMFEHVLDKLSVGESIGKIMRESNRGSEKAQFIRWIMKDAKRKARYEEALEYGAEVIKSQLIDIADGISDTGDEAMEDIQRSKLRIETRMKVMGFDHRKKFGDIKTVEINQNISITDALSAAKARMADIIDAEVTDTPLLDNEG